MADEVNQENNLAVSETGVTAEAPQTELENRLTQANARLTELEQVVASKDSELAVLKQSLAEAIASYRIQVAQTNPEIAELIKGDAIETINNSVKQATALVNKVRKGLEAEISLTRVPAGAPGRTSPELSLSPREKIQSALTGRIK